jgi:hypothetical protein
MRNLAALAILMMIPQLAFFSCGYGGTSDTDAGLDGDADTGGDDGGAPEDGAVDGADPGGDAGGDVGGDLGGDVGPASRDIFILFMEPGASVEGMFGKLLLATKRQGEVEWTVAEVDSGLYDSQFYTYASLEIALDSAGRPHAAYMAFAARELRYTRFDGAAWVKADGTPGHDVVDTDVFTYNAKHFLVLRDDRAHLAYRQDTNLVYYAWDGSAWQREVALTLYPETGEPNPGGGPALFLDSTGEPHVAHHDHHEYRLHYAHRQAGTWLNQLIPGGPTMVGEYKNITLDQQQHPHILFDEGYTRFDGAEWVDAAGDPGYDAFDCGFISSAFSPGGEVVLGERRDQDLVLHRKSLNATAWEPGVTVFSGMSTVDIAVDENSRAHLAVTRVRESDNQELLCLYEGDDGWTSELVYHHDGFLRVVHPSLALGPE